MTYRELRRLLVDHGCRYLRDARGGGTRDLAVPWPQAHQRAEDDKRRGHSPENLEGRRHQTGRLGATALKELLLAQWVLK